MIPSSCAVLRANLADPDENKPDTDRIQQALDHCASGQAVELQPDGRNNAFLAGPLLLRTGVTLHVGKGVILFGSRNPRDYDLTPGRCGTVDSIGHGCRALINGDHADHAGVIGEGVIDGRGGAKLLGENVSWWDLAQEAKVKNQNQNCPRLMILSHCNDFTLYKITLKNSPNFHVSYSQGDGFTAWGVIIDTPKTARNTDGIDPANSTNVTITHCYIHAGDDNVAIKAGGNSGPSTNMSILHNHFYTGHGMSIGSETDAGANHIHVEDLSIDGADNGIRIKSNSSRGGLVEDVIYQDVCIRDTKNPIFMDTNYSFYGKERNKLPTFRNITLRNVHIYGPGKITLEGYDANHRLQMNFDGVTIAGGAASNISATFADFTMGPGPVNFEVRGKDVHVTQTPVKLPSGNSCEGRFVPMPRDESR